MSTLKTSVSNPEPDPDSGAFWIQGLKKRSKMLNQQKTILLFTTIFQLTLLMIKWIRIEIFGWIWIQLNTDSKHC